MWPHPFSSVNTNVIWVTFKDPDCSAISFKPPFLKQIKGCYMVYQPITEFFVVIYIRIRHKDFFVT